METDTWENGRTVVVSGVPNVLPPGRITDKLTIHFQSTRKSDGGDVEKVKYPTNMDGVAFVTFVKAKDAARVVEKKQHIMTDSQFPEDFVLTVFPFSTDVFFYVPSATVDLSIFGGNRDLVIESLRSAHRSLRFRPVPQQRKAFIEGPFAAVQALRGDLIRRADELQSAVTVQTAGINPRESSHNTRLISHHKYVDSVSHSSSKREPASSLSTLLQSPGEASEIQRLLSKTQNASLRQKVSSDSLARGRILKASINGKDKLEVQPTEQRKANHIQVVEKEIKASALSGLPQPDAISTTEPYNDGASQKHPRAGKISATEIRREGDLGSHQSSMSCLKNPSSSAVRSKLLQTELKGISKTLERYTEGPAMACAVGPEGQDDIWVDSYIFRYIKTFHKKELDRCFAGTDLSVRYVVETDLMQISLTEQQRSKVTSGVQKAIQKLKTLFESWQSILRVHKIFYHEVGLSDKYLLNQICGVFCFQFEDVLYIFEDSCIKAISPSVPSLLFNKKIKEGIIKFKDTLVNFRQSSRNHERMYFNH